jgi:hypothetical protein
MRAASRSGTRAFVPLLGLGLWLGVLGAACQGSSSGTPDASVMDGSATAGGTTGDAASAMGGNLGSAGAGSGGSAGGACAEGGAAGSPTGTGKADVSFTDRIGQDAETRNFIATAVTATVTPAGATPPSGLRVDIAATTTGGRPVQMVLLLSDTTAEGIHPGVVYLLRPPGEAATPTMTASLTYTETSCRGTHTWVANGQRGGASVGALGADTVACTVVDASFVPDQATGATGTFTIRAQITAPRSP